MPGINFLDNQKHDDQKPKDKDDKKDKLVWSSPKKEIKEPKKSSNFSFLSFLNKKKPADKSPVSIIDKNRIKQSREEILNLIKHHEDLKPLPKEKSKSFLRAIGEKFKKQPGHKEVLIDYQRVFNQEKEQKNQVNKIFNIKPAAETRPVPKTAEKPKHDWFKELTESVKRKIIALSAHKNEEVKIIKLPKAEEIKPVAKPPEPPPLISKPEEKSVEVKEIKIEESEPIHKNEVRQRVIETNLIQGELVTFFDWHSKIIISVSAILMPIFVVGAVYYGLAFYQKSNQAKNLAQAQKFAELEQSITKEEAGLKEISDFEAQLKIVSKVFEQHLYWTNFFNFLEDNTIKDVYFINFDGDTSGNYIMDALAASYSSISEQVNVFKNNKKITAAEAEGGDLVAGDDTNESLVKFIFNFSITKSIFIE
ncbi:MAG: hypothetical protein Q8O59_02440 [bacterium]|nr:hypothetical protein [bacterium]